jgi:hypothetical protein
VLGGPNHLIVNLPMLQRLLAGLVISTVVATSAAAAPPYSPYSDASANGIYNLLFCDTAEEFRHKPGELPAHWQSVLEAEPADLAALRALANDALQEGRVRYLAYSRLRQLREPVPAKRLLGVIVEVPLQGGLDVLATYSEGSVRYINQTGKLAFYERVESLNPLVQRLISDSSQVVARIGPTDQPRRPPPRGESVRITFLVSDGYYFGEGSMKSIQQDALAGPVIQRAVELLQAAVALIPGK